MDIFDDSFVSDSYREKVQTAAKEMNGHIFLNRDIDHAWYLFKTILKCAEKDEYPVRIICGHLRRGFYGSLCKYASDAIKAGCSLDVYVTSCTKQELFEDNNEFAEMMRKEGKEDSLHCRDSANDELDNEAIESIPHMILVGEEGEIFRYETDNSKCEALVAFGKTKLPESFGKRLKNIFDGVTSKYWCAARAR